ncbi:hypothetical protein BKA70DRAFT_1236394 [Coprinopsis sp. MPI-PUGE-AT-0042]|nr:hypothetical protein BKA70DRAFT_1236394 [Coprinopsis sp. MPI-PUGE-AT-0042]
MADATIPIPKLQRIFLVDGGIKGLIKRVNCNAAALALISRERRRGLFASYSDMAAWFDMKRFDSATGLSSALWNHVVVDRLGIGGRVSYIRWVAPNYLDLLPTWLWDANLVIGRYKKYVMELRNLCSALGKACEGVYPGKYFDGIDLAFCGLKSQDRPSIGVRFLRGHRGIVYLLAIILSNALLSDKVPVHGLYSSSQHPSWYLSAGSSRLCLVYERLPIARKDDWPRHESLQAL